MESIEKEKLNEARNQYLKDLISGKTLIEWLTFFDSLTTSVALKFV